MSDNTSALPAWAKYAALGIITIVLALVFGKSSGNMDDTVIAIKNRHTGKYLSVSVEDGLVRTSADSSHAPHARFRVVALSSTTVRLLKPAKVRKPLVSKKLCACSGFSDEHGFGRYCHNWESEHHRPWCYVHDSCEGARHGSKMRKHQACASDTGYLGPDGWVPPPGCSCSGHESIHGFGSECKGWEFPGQTPWCYTDDNCTQAAGTAGSFASKHVECVRNVPPPPPSPPNSPPPIPSPPPPPSPPPAPWVENRNGWGTSNDCICSGYNSSLGFGAYCSGWEFEGQEPWCYVVDGCTSPASSGSFGRKFMTCTKKPSPGLLGRRISTLFGRRRRLKAEDVKKEPTPLSAQVEKTTGKKASSKAGSKALITARASGGVVTPTAKQAKRVEAAKRSPTGKPPKKLPFDAEQAALIASAASRQRVALVSEATGGFLVAEPPPHKLELFLRGDGEELSQRAVFALPSKSSGSIIALGAGALVNLCMLKPDATDEPLAACTGTPTVLRRRHTARRGAGEHHRKLLLKTLRTSEWIIERVAP